MSNSLGSALRAQAAALVLIAASAAGAAAQTPDPLVAKINGVEIHQSDLTIAEEDIGAQLPQDIPPQARREYLITYISDMILLAQDAEGQGMSGSDEFKRRFLMARNKVLMTLDLQSVISKAVADDAFKHKVYDEAIAAMKSQPQEEEIHVRHILVKTEDEAKAVLADLKKGAKFADVAKAKSIEPNAATSGGDLGSYTKDELTQQMIPEFTQAALKLDKGQMSDPVQTPFGWHIIWIEDKRARPLPTYDEAKDQVGVMAARRARQDLINKLRKTAKIERVDAPPAAPAPATPAAPAPAPMTPAPTMKK